MLSTCWLVSQNSKYITKGSTFVAIKGNKLNGIDFIVDALENGALTIVVDQEVPDIIKLKIKEFSAKLIVVEDTRKALADLSSVSWGNPQNKLKIIGITGTKGKTTTTYLIRHILKEAGFKTAMLSGVKNYILDCEFNSELTTPHADFIFAFLAQCVKSDVEYVVMEVSAQGLSLHRVDNIDFAAVVFTNLSQEHAEFYKSMDLYFEAKTTLFNMCSSKTGVINVNDEWGKKLSLLQPSFKTLEILENKSFAPFDPAFAEASADRRTFSPEQDRRVRANGDEDMPFFDSNNFNNSLNSYSSDVILNKGVPFVLSLSKQTNDNKITNIRTDFNGLSYDLVSGSPFVPSEHSESRDRVTSISAPNLIGRFNAINSADAFVLTKLLGIDEEKILSAIKNFKGVPGRMESYKLANDALGIVDYAHTPSSFTEVLSTLRSLTKDLIVVFGAGGGKDPIKRPIMGKIAAELADKVVITSDNPRHENPQLITQDILAGIAENLKYKVYIEQDRFLAIQKAYSLSNSGSIILVLGKGPDEYQILGDTKLFFSDKDSIQKFI